MKKKFVASSKDKKDWTAFTKQMGNINAKEIDLIEKDIKEKKIQKIDLHGFSLEQANKEIEKFIIKSFNTGYRKLLVVTGKGLRSKSYGNPYLSQKFSVLKYSVPEYLSNNKNLVDKINKITEADQKDGGEGAIYIFLKHPKNLKNKF